MRVFLYSRWQELSVSVQLVTVVNTILGVSLLVLLTLKYHDEMKDEIEKKQTGLADEAIAIHSAIEHLYAAHSHEDIQRYIDDISSRMRQSDGLEHHIAIQLEPNSILTNSQDRCDGALLAAMKRATRPGSEQTHEPPNLVSADYSAGGVSVYVAESLAEIRSTKWNEIKQQLTVLGLLACLAALIINLVLLRTVGHPSGVLSNTVDSISRGNFHVRAPAFRSREMQQLSLSVNEMSKALQLVERERQAQLAKAQAIQAHLLPNEVVLPAAETGHLFQPADIVAGDYYDFIPREDGDWVICLADVTGHGIPAALGATMLKSYLLIATEDSDLSAGEILAEVNRRFEKTVLPGNFASMFLAIWNPQGKVFSWASAGHDPGILLEHGGRLHCLDSTGLLLGIDPNASWNTLSLTLQTGDQLLLFSDGVPETTDSAGRIFTRQRLAESFANLQEKSPEETLAAIDEQLTLFRSTPSSHDDITMIAMRVD